MRGYRHIDTLQIENGSAVGGHLEGLQRFTVEVAVGVIDSIARIEVEVPRCDGNIGCRSGGDGHVPARASCVLRRDAQVAWAAGERSVVAAATKVGGTADGCAEHAIVIADIGQGEGQGRLDATGAGLQHPVPAPSVCTGEVGGSGHVSAGALGQRLDEIPPSAVGADLAAVEKNVAIGVQGLAETGERLAVAGQVLAIQPEIAQLHLAGVAVTKDMYDIDATSTVEIVGNLLQAVLAAVEHHHFGARFQAAYQLLIVLNPIVHKHHFLALWRPRGTLGSSLRFCGQCMPQCAGRIHRVLRPPRRRSVRGRMCHIHRSSAVKHKALLQRQRAHGRGRLQALGGIGFHCLRRHGLCQTVPEWARFAGHQSVLPV